MKKRRKKSGNKSNLINNIVLAAAILELINQVIELIDRFTK